MLDDRFIFGLFGSQSNWSRLIYKLSKMERTAGRYMLRNISMSVETILYGYPNLYFIE